LPRSKAGFRHGEDKRKNNEEGRVPFFCGLPMIEGGIGEGKKKVFLDW